MAAQMQLSAVCARFALQTQRAVGKFAQKLGSQRGGGKGPTDHTGHIGHKGMNLAHYSE